MVYFTDFIWKNILEYLLKPQKVHNYIIKKRKKIKQLHEYYTIKKEKKNLNNFILTQLGRPNKRCKTYYYYSTINAVVPTNTRTDNTPKNPITYFGSSQPHL
jgi:hypothetical protein